MLNSLLVLTFQYQAERIDFLDAVRETAITFFVALVLKYLIKSLKKLFFLVASLLPLPILVAMPLKKEHFGDFPYFFGLIPNLAVKKLISKASGNAIKHIPF